MTPQTPATNSPSSKPSSRPFKKFYCDDREVFRLPGIAFKIWMYHYAREGKERKSWPTAETICEALDINRSTLQRWRKYLIQHSWLERIGEHRRLDGEFNVPIFKAKRGSVDEIISDGRRSNVIHRRNNQLPTETIISSATETKESSVDRDENFIHEVDSGLLDTERVDSGLLEANRQPYSLQITQTFGQDELGRLLTDLVVISDGVAIFNRKRQRQIATALEHYTPEQIIDQWREFWAEASTGQQSWKNSAPARFSKQLAGCPSSV